MPDQSDRPRLIPARPDPGDLERYMITFEAWTPLMVAALAKLSRLPPRDDATFPGNLAVAIHQLACQPDGEGALILIVEHFEDFKFAPSGEQLLDLAQALLATEHEVEHIQRTGPSIRARHAR